MLSIKYLIIITKREDSEKYLEFFSSHGLAMVESTLCNGTASDSVLDFMGLAKTEMIMLKTVVPESKEKEIKDGLIFDMDIRTAGNGIAVFVQMDGIGGQSSLKSLIGEEKLGFKEEIKMEECTKKAVLIISIVDKGYHEIVMDAARGAGAGGGTVVKAKGTGASVAKFFGVAISEEKEMIYIVAKNENRDEIMKAIMEKAGAGSEAHGIVFSLPVDNVLGIANLE